MHVHRLEEEVLDPEAAHLAVPLPDPVEQLRIALHITGIDLGELTLEFSRVYAQLDEPFPDPTKAPARTSSPAGAAQLLSARLRVRSQP